MNIIKTFLLAALFVLPVFVTAQYPCGTVETEEMMDRLRQNKKYFAAHPDIMNKDGQITYVPTKFHLIAKSDGSNRISEPRVLDFLCHLNEAYADQDIQFYIYYGFNYINNNIAYDNPGQSPLIIQSERDPKAMNIYIGQNADTEGGIGTTLGYYDPGFDIMVIKKSEIDGSSDTGPHEVGHYLSLAHPFRGWDCTSWNEDDHGLPVSSMQAPCNANIQVELADGSNCETAGDLICDTPADYNLGFGWPNCNYTGPCLDPNGDPVDPQEDNYMGYFLNCNEYIFTPTQKALMAADLANRPVLDTDFSPIATEITEVPELIVPEEGVTTAGYNNVEFKWTEVPGATKYVFELSIVSNFSIFPQRYVVTSPYLKLTNLEPSDEYFWRVRPFNDYYTCADFSERGSFITGATTDVNVIEAVSGWEVRPNPVTSGNMLEIAVNTTETMDANVLIYTIEGQLIQTVSTTFAQGNNMVNINTADLASGLYLVSLQTAEGVLSKKVVVTK
jgi:hypothetical protein